MMWSQGRSRNLMVMMMTCAHHQMMMILITAETYDSDGDEGGKEASYDPDFDN